MTDLAGRAEQARRLTNEMWSGAGDSAVRTREQVERYPELTAAALGLSLFLLVLVVLVVRAMRRSTRRHQAAQLRDDLVDAVRMGEIDFNDFRVFAMIDFCDRVAKGGRRPHSGRHASTRPVLDSALAGSLISAVGPGSLLPPGGPFWPYAAPEPGEVEISDIWVRAVSFQRQVMGRRRSRDAEIVEPVPTPGSAPAPRRLVSVPTGELPSLVAPLAQQHVDLPDDDAAVATDAVTDVAEFDDPWAPVVLGEAMFDAATPIADSILVMGDTGVNHDEITSVDAAPATGQQAVGDLSTDDVVVTSGLAAAMSEVRVETVFQGSEVKSGSEVVTAVEAGAAAQDVGDQNAGDESASESLVLAEAGRSVELEPSVEVEPLVEPDRLVQAERSVEAEPIVEADRSVEAAVSEIAVPEPEDDVLSSPRRRSRAARPFDPLIDPLSSPVFEPGEAPSEELEPVFLAAAAAQKAADQAAHERADQERVMKERVARRWAALKQVAKERAAESIGGSVGGSVGESAAGAVSGAVVETGADEVNEAVAVTNADEAVAVAEVAPLEPALSGVTAEAARGEVAPGEAARGEGAATEWVEPVRSIDLRSLDLRPLEAPQQIDLTRIERLQRLQGQPVEVLAGRPSSLRSSAATQPGEARGHRSVTERVTGPIPILPFPAIDGQAGLEKSVVSGPVDLPLTRRELRRSAGEQRAVRYHVGDAHVAGEPDAADSEPEWESAPPTNPIPIPVLLAPSAREELGPDEPDQNQSELRPRWMSPGLAPAEPVGGVVEVVGRRGQSREEGPSGPSPRSGFWGRRAPRRSRSNLVEVTGHGKPPGALVPFDQVPPQGGAPGAETEDVRDAPMVGDEAVR